MVVRLRTAGRGCAAALALLAVVPAFCYDNGLGRTPPMGWNSWCTGTLLEPSVCNLVGNDPCSEGEVKAIADSLVANGMDKLGYEFLELDDCWSDTARDASGQLQADARKFPSGMASLADYVHARGLKLGLYTSVGDKTCKGDRPGSYGHYATDASTLAGWGVDMIKMDHCGAKGNGTFTDRQLYGEMSAALNATGRPVLFSLCSWGEQSVLEWGADVAQMYRIQMDHLPFFNLPTTASGVGYGQGTLQIINYVADIVPSRWTRTFGWLDPDFLMTRYGTMDFVASRTEYSFWSLWSAPLLVATDLRKLSADKRAILLNEEVIAINQDGSATSGDRIRPPPNVTGVDSQLWARPLANGDKAVILFNAGKRKGLGVAVAWAELGWAPADSVRVRDLWAKKDLGVFTAGFNATLDSHDVAMLRLTRQ